MASNQEQVGINGQPGQDLAREPSHGEQVRTWTTAKLRELVEVLDPYVNGTLGDVSPRHATVYLQAVRELNKLWGAYEVPESPSETPPATRAAQVRGQVLAALEALRERP